MSDVRRGRKGRPKRAGEPTRGLVRGPSRQGRAVSLTYLLQAPEIDQDLFSAEELQVADIIEAIGNSWPGLPGAFGPPKTSDEGPMDGFSDLPADLEDALRDEDENGLEELSVENEPNLWPDAPYATDPDGNPQDSPLPAIEINEFGEVMVLSQAYLNRCAELQTISLLDVDGNLGKGLKRAEILRAFGEAIVESNREELLHGPPVFEEARLAPLNQKSLFADVTVPANSSAIVANTYVKTPLWGIVPLSAFLVKVDEWEETLQTVRAFLDGEDVANPDSMSSNASRWAMLLDARRHLKKLQNNRMLREKMRQHGIPLTTGRKVLYQCVRKWVRKEKPARIGREKVPAIYQKLMAEYGLFSTPYTLGYRKELFRPFVEGRIIKILETLEVAIR